MVATQVARDESEEVVAQRSGTIGAQAIEQC